jgi:hypothetical protein
LVRSQARYGVAAWAFQRLLGLVYLLAFWSLSVQILGLAGEHGMLPARLYMDGARLWAATERVGFERFHLVPTLCWISTSDAFLTGLCVAGMALGALLALGCAPAVMLPLLWIGYLSLAIVCREFLSYQWDALLLEAGFLAIFLAPLTWWDRLAGHVDPPNLGPWLMRWLLFRLMLGSGLVKLASGDPTWRSLTALTFHFETQPIPTPIAWYAHNLPAWLHTGSTLGVLAIETIAPFFMFGSRRWRQIGCGVLVGLQAAIALTGNYAFFNLLAAALCVFLLDDESLSIAGLKSGPDRDAVAPSDHGRIRRAVLAGVAVVTVPVSALAFAGSVGLTLPGWPLLEPMAGFIAPFRSVNSYGLFAVMTTERPEIIIEGSNDGVAWHEYEFQYQAGDPSRRPPWIAPHQPRLDWQMWFAALSRYEQEPWFRSFCARLLEGSPDVLRLLDRDPFDGRPPRYVRGVLYRYRFSNRAAARTDGTWWTRERIGGYSPAMSLDSPVPR